MYSKRLQYQPPRGKGRRLKTRVLLCCKGSLEDSFLKPTIDSAIVEPELLGEMTGWSLTLAECVRLFDLMKHTYGQNVGSNGTKLSVSFTDIKLEQDQEEDAEVFKTPKKRVQSTSEFTGERKYKRCVSN